MNQYDLIVIGSGPGGYETAAEAAGKFGINTILFTDKESADRELIRLGVK